MHANQRGKLKTLFKDDMNLYRGNLKDIKNVQDTRSILKKQLYLYMFAMDNTKIEFRKHFHLYSQQNE